MTDAKLTTLNCTQCGAGLTAYGGGRVLIHVCSHCGATLDAQDDYKVLKRNRELPRPKSPFELGATGKIDDIEFTVIGTIAWLESHLGMKWRWVDHQIFSPTHGYAWLTWEDGQAVFTRKVRGLATPSWLTAASIERAEFRPSVAFGGKNYRYYSSGFKKPTFVEGEFNYSADLDMQPHYVSCLSGQNMFTMVGNGDEQEYEDSRLVPREEALEAFGADPGQWPESRKVHPLQAFKRSASAAFARNGLLAGGVVSLVMALVFGSFGDDVAKQSFPSLSALEPMPFEVTSQHGLVQIDINTNISNGWISLEGEVVDATDNTVAAFEDGAEYYSGRDSEGRWSEGSKRVRLRVDLPPGPYVLKLGVSENVGDKKWSGIPATNARASIIQGVARVYWLWVVTALLFAGGLAFLAQRQIHDTRRWSGSDWTD
ncbi:MAG: DUF4178 domain-containing protein [Gammaproteobacteria bacterium]